MGSYHYVKDVNIMDPLETDDGSGEFLVLSTDKKVRKAAGGAGGDQDLLSVTENGATTNIPMTVNDGTDRITHSAKAVIFEKLSAGYTVSVEADAQTGNRKATIPALDADKTFAFVEDLPEAQGLQSVTDVNNTTNDDLNIGMKITFNEANSKIEDDGGSLLHLHPEEHILESGNTSGSQVQFRVKQGEQRPKYYTLAGGTKDVAFTDDLEAKADKDVIARDVTDTTASSATSETIVWHSDISAGQLSVGYMLLDFIAQKTGTTGTCEVKVYRGTSLVSTAGATQLARYTMTATQLFASLTRRLILKPDGTIFGFPANNSSANDLIANATAPLSTSYDKTTAHKILVAITLSSGSDSIQIKSGEIRNPKA